MSRVRTPSPAPALRVVTEPPHARRPARNGDGPSGPGDYHRRLAPSEGRTTVTDYQEQIDNIDASYDEIDAERLRPEAAASQQAAQSQLDAAGTDAQRGHPEDIARHVTGAVTDTLEGVDAAGRAQKLDVAAGLHAASTET